MKSIMHIFTRINTIQKRFNNLFYNKQQRNKLNNKSFKDVLKNKVQQKQNGIKLDISPAAQNKQAAAAQGPRYAEFIKEAAAKYNIPGNLIKAVIKQESGFNPQAVSSKGAQGLMQLMPDTARKLHVKNAFSPRENIMGGSNYLGQLLTSYKGDTVKALAAYNAGPEALDGGAVPDFPETQNYIKKVLQNYMKYNGVDN